MARTTNTFKLHAGSLKDSLRMLRELDDEAGAVRMLRTSLKFAAAPLVSEMKRRVPYLTPETNNYHLRDYISIRLESKRRRQTKAQFRIGAHRLSQSPGEQGYRIVGGLTKKGSAANYAIKAEEKTHWMSDSIDSEVPTLVRLFTKESARRITKALARKVRREDKVLSS